MGTNIQGALSSLSVQESCFGEKFDSRITKHFCLSMNLKSGIFEALCLPRISNLSIRVNWSKNAIWKTKREKKVPKVLRRKECAKYCCLVGPQKWLFFIQTAVIADLSVGNENLLL